MNHTKKTIVTINSKKGISIMIGYVLLVSFAIIIGGILYSWMKTYVPTEALDCPDGVSIFVEEVICQGGNLNLTLRNNGRFNIAGYFIHATDEVGQELATLDLSEYILAGGTLRSNSIVYDMDENAMEPAETKKSIFNLFIDIHSIDIIPIRFQIEDNKQRFVSCGNAKIREIVNCEDVPEIPSGCGNSTIDAGEECDDGNTNNGEGCSSTCTAETGWTCVGEPSVCTEDTIQKRIIFVSSNTYNGNLGGLSGADTICNNLASASGLSGGFKAWLSHSTSNISDEIIPDDVVAFYLSDNTTKVADNSTDLLSGTIQNFINLDESGTINNIQVWTGTNESGYVTTNQHCSDWTSSSPSVNGKIGNSNRQNKEWTDYGDEKCNDAYAIYCFQTSGW